MLNSYGLIRFFDMFSGIGGFRAGLERAGGYECIGHCEIDPHANTSYKVLHNPKESEVFYEDATKIDTATMPAYELLCAGFPCQSFSAAGKRKGFEDERGTMFFEIARVLEAKKPEYVLLENVQGLLSHNRGRTFEYIISTLCQLGYSCEWQVLNSKDFGVPQSRRRVYIIGYLNRRCAGKVFPFIGANPENLKLLLRGRWESDRVYDAMHLAKTITCRESGNYMIPLNVKEATKKGYKEAYPGDSVDLSFAGANTRRGRVGHGIAHTITTLPMQGVVLPKGKIRRLTPKECLRLQGFTDEQIDRLLAVTTETRAYKQAGNAVTVNVVCAIGIRLKKIHDEIHNIKQS